MLISWRMRYQSGNGYGDKRLRKTIEYFEQLLRSDRNEFKPDVSHNWQPAGIRCS
jgi:hypothetical protein